MRSRAREPRIDDDQRRLGALVGTEHVQQRHRMRLGGIAADDEHRLAVVHVVVGVGHRAVAPGVGYARDGGRVADPRLVVAVVGAPHGVELAEQIRLLVVVLGRAEPVHRVGTGLLADLEELVADLVDGLLPRNALPLAVLELGRILQTALAVPGVSHRGALGAVAAEAEGMVEGRLLTGPDAVLHFRHDTATDRAVVAHGANHLVDPAGTGRLGMGLSHH